MIGPALQPGAAAAKGRRRPFVVPWLTLIVTALALLAQLDPATWELNLLVAGQPWRWLTGHLVHWDASHLAYDLLAFIALGAMAEQASRRRTVATIVLAAVAGSAAFCWFDADLVRYRGLSGIGSALFVLVLSDLALRSRGAAIVASVGLVGFCLKIGFELVASKSLFASGVDWSNVPAVHLAGAAVGGSVTVVSLVNARGSCRPTGGSLTRPDPTAARRAAATARGP